MTITSREALFLSDHVAMESACMKHLQFASENCTDPQLKKMCEIMALDHKNFINSLTRHVNPNLQ